MAFDLSSVLNQAQEVSNQNQGGGNNPRLIYPGTGTLKVKLLYNPKSNSVSRLVRRHKVGNTNYICLSMYGQDCPICKTVDAIKNSTGADLWKYNAKARGISYAQYVGSEGYTWDNDEPQQGELILLMYPWTVYQDINRVLASAGTRAEELIALNEGKIVNIVHWRENSQEKYKCEVDAFAANFKSCATDEEFEKFMNDLPNLNEAVCPPVMDEKTHKASNDAAETLSREHLRGVNNSMSGGFSGNQMGTDPQIVNIGGQNYVMMNGQYVPVADTPVTQNNSVPQSVPQQTTPQVPNMQQSVQQNAQMQNTVPNNPTSQQNNSPVMNPPESQNNVQQSVPTNGNGQSMPECFGKHKDQDPKCMACMNEIPCMTMA